jgi:hypothetical protein
VLQPLLLDWKFGGQIDAADPLILEKSMQILDLPTDALQLPPA